MWNKILDKAKEIIGFLCLLVVSLLLGKSYAQKKQAEKELKEKEEQAKKEAQYKAEAHKIKEEIFKEAANEKDKLNTGSNTDKFNAACDILRKH